MLRTLSAHSIARDVQRGEHTVPIGRKGSSNINQLASLSSHTCGRNCHLPRAIFYTWTSLCPNTRCFLARTHLAAPWTGALRLAGQVPAERALDLSHGDKQHREAPAMGHRKDVDVIVGGVAAVIWENYLPRVPLSLSHCQDPYSNLHRLSHCASTSRPSSRALHPSATPLLSASSIISLTETSSPEAGAKLLTRPLVTGISLRDSTNLAFCSHPSSHQIPRSWVLEYATHPFGRQMVSLHPASGLGI